MLNIHARPRTPAPHPAPLGARECKRFERMHTRCMHVRVQICTCELCGWTMCARTRARARDSHTHTHRRLNTRAAPASPAPSIAPPSPAINPNMLWQYSAWASCAFARAFARASTSPPLPLSELSSRPPPFPSAPEPPPRTSPPISAREDRRNTREKGNMAPVPRHRNMRACIH